MPRAVLCAMCHQYHMPGTSHSTFPAITPPASMTPQPPEPLDFARLEKLVEEHEKRPSVSTPPEDDPENVGKRIRLDELTAQLKAATRSQHLQSFTLSELMDEIGRRFALAECPSFLKSRAAANCIEVRRDAERARILDKPRT